MNFDKYVPLTSQPAPVTGGSHVRLQSAKRRSKPSAGVSSPTQNSSNNTRHGPTSTATLAAITKMSTLSQNVNPYSNFLMS